MPEQGTESASRHFPFEVPEFREPGQPLLGGQLRGHGLHVVDGPVVLEDAGLGRARGVLQQDTVVAEL